jgi:hypothetical protein
MLMRRLLRSLAMAGLLLWGGATVRAQIPIAPSEEAYKLALGRLTEAERAALKDGRRIVLSATQASFEPPVDTLTGKSVADICKVDYPAFVDFINRELAGPDARQVEIKKIRSFVREIADTGKMAYGFRVEIDGVDDAKRELHAKGVGTGPAFSMWRVVRTETNPLSVRSANVAFMVATLRAVIQLQ